MQQCLPFTVCAEGCETAEEQSDDEVRTSQVPERSEGKTKVIRQQYLPFTVCTEGCETAEEQRDDEVRTSQVPERSEGKTKVIRQQHLPFTVCAEGCETAEEQSDDEVRTSQVPERREGKTKMMKQQHLPFTVLKLYFLLTSFSIARLQQCLPFTVLKLEEFRASADESRNRCNSTYRLRYTPKGARQQWSKATMRSAHLKYLNEEKVKRRWWSNSTYRLRYWNTLIKYDHSWWYFRLQQHLPFTVCAEGCETAEEQSDDEVRTSQVPKRSEGKTKVIRQQYLPFTVLKL